MEMTMDKFVAYLKQLGFVYQGSEIYGGLANTWDYGPLGVELKNNLKKLWWKTFVQSSVNNVGIDSAILMNPQTWVATGHVGGFSDPLIDCKCCNTRYRADKLIEDFTHGSETGDGWDNDRLYNYVMDNKIPCPNCGKTNFTEIRKFNLMFQTHQGVVEDAKTVVYLRPETAQGIFLNFKNVQRTTRKKVPFGICQIGKSFRNEITPGKFFFGWGELWGIADRTDYDLSMHQKHSGENLEYLDPETNEKYLPYVIEPSLGVERLLLAVLTSAYEEETLSDGETREVLHFDPRVAPIKMAVLPLVNKLNDKALELYQMLKKYFVCEYDSSGKIGKRYRRQDSIGTPYCITVDFETLEDNSVTIRNRDSMEQFRINIDDLLKYFNDKF